jgi:very-short-patch-repair endonuclease
MLAIEIDGYSHDFKDDEKRQLRLESFGIKFLRFNDREPKSDIRPVVQAIQNWLEEWMESDSSLD